MDEQHFMEQINVNKGILIKVSNLYADDPEDRKDLRQEIILQCWKSMPNFKGHSKFSTWLYRISLNVSLTFFSRYQRRNAAAASVPIVDFYETPERSERADQLYRAIRKLDEVDRGLIMLHLDGYDNLAISEMMGLSKNNTGVKLHRIKLQLTNFLNQK